MGQNTAIEWADHTFNPWIGCTAVSPACDHCYAEALATTRLGVAWGPKAERRRTAESTWRQPLAWNRKAEREGRRYRVFCASLADVFDNRAPENAQRDLWATIEATPHLDWLLLTKRPQNVARMLPQGWIQTPRPNVWLGTTVENQAEADRRIPHLLAVPAARRFLSCEPLLGPVNLESWLAPEKACHGCDDGEGYGNRCSRADIPREEQCPWNHAVQTVVEHGPFNADGAPASITCRVETIDWVICGGESGPDARAMHPDWARGLRDQCAAAGVPFLFKQWGEWAPSTPEQADGNPRSGWRALRGHPHLPKPSELYPETGAAFVAHVGKKAAGRQLDGVQHDGVPA